MEATRKQVQAVLEILLIKSTSSLHKQEHEFEGVQKRQCLFQDGQSKGRNQRASSYDQRVWLSSAKQMLESWADRKY